MTAFGLCFSSSHGVTTSQLGIAERTGSGLCVTGAPGLQMPEPALDRDIRGRAFERVLALERIHQAIPWSEIKRGFAFKGEKIHLATKARGIFKPRQMHTLLSIKTVTPRPGRRVWYDDQHQVEQSIFEEREYFDYAMMAGGPNASGNLLLKRAWTEKTPIIYFMGLSPERYVPIAPAFIYGWDARSGTCQIGPGKIVGTPTSIVEQRPFEPADDRRYYLSQTQQRAHQAIFRAAVMDAYKDCCAISGLRETSLLDAAHIVEDKHQTLGQPVVCNGLPLTKIHHAAFDSNLIGVDPDYRIHVSDQLLDLTDGPMLEALKGVDGNRIRLPKRAIDCPDPERLEERFARFRAAM